MSLSLYVKKRFTMKEMPLFNLEYRCFSFHILVAEMQEKLPEGRLLTLNVSSSKNCLAEETQSSFSY